MRTVLPRALGVMLASIVAAMAGSCSSESVPSPASATAPATAPAPAPAPELAPSPASAPIGRNPAPPTPACLVTPQSIGPLRLGMRLQAAQGAMPQARFSRTSDGEGVALVEMTVDGDSLAIVYTGEEDAEAPVDMARAIEHIETFSAACATAEGVHPGSTVEAAEAAYGPLSIIRRSEIESREYVEFARQPPGLQFRLDYSGEFADGQSETRRQAPGAKLFSIAVSRP